MAIERFEPKTINHQILRALVEMMNKGRVANIAALVNCRRPVLEIALGQLVKSKHLTYNTLSGLYTVTDEALRIHDLKPIGVETMEDGDMGNTEGKKCTFCEKTKAPSEYYANSGRCKTCFNAFQRVSKLRKEGKPIPAELAKFAAAPPGRQPAPSAQPASKAKLAFKRADDVPPVVATAGPFRIVPETVTECSVIGSGQHAEAVITQPGGVHYYRLKELQQLRDWATTVLKREMAA